MSVSEMIYPQSVLSSIFAGMNTLPSKRNYVAPTVYKLAGVTISGWNYYKSFADALEKLRWLVGVNGAKNITAAGSVTFTGNSAQTCGLNTDFFIAVNESYATPVTYEFQKSAISQGIKKLFVYRMFLSDGSGPYYAVFDPRYFNISASILSNVPADKLAQLDEFHRSVAILKGQHNSLVNFLNEQIKLPVTPARQMTINQGQMAISNMRAQLGTIQGLDITYGSAGQIGVIMLAPIIYWAIAAAVTAWSVSAIVTEVQKTKRITASFNFQSWAQEHKLRLAQEAQAGNISQADALALSTATDKAAAAAAKVAENSSKGSGGFGDLSTMVKWGGITFIALAAIKAFK